MCGSSGVLCRIDWLGYVFCCVVLFFFFQAEDGIRVAQESRGLGDVYKRQETSYAEIHRHTETKDTIINFAPDKVVTKKTEIAPVSYTHLTLPTIYSV